MHVLQTVKSAARFDPFKENEQGNHDEEDVHKIGSDKKKTNVHYYTELMHIIRNESHQFEIASIMDACSAIPPLLRHVNWNVKKIAVVPETTYSSRDSRFSLEKNQRLDSLESEYWQRHNITLIKADFSNDSFTPTADVVLCANALEHADFPKKLFGKLLKSASKRLIIGVPYMWPEIFGGHHLADYISEVTLLKWSGQIEPLYHRITNDKHLDRDTHGRRLIQVYAGL